MSFQEEVADVAVREWAWFGKDIGDKDRLINGKNKEAVEPYAQRVGDYWLSIPTKKYEDLIKDYAKNLGKLDGTLTKLPWSAAFVSYCFNMAGAGTQFPYSAGHATWIIKSISNRASGKLKASLVGYRLGEKPVEIGDIFGRGRSKGADVTYDTAVKTGWFESHSDIVVEIDQANRKAFLIGGNVGQSVAKTEIKLDSEGKALIGTGRYFVHIKNQIAPPTKPFTPSALPPKAG